MPGVGTSWRGACWGPVVWFLLQAMRKTGPLEGDLGETVSGRVDWSELGNLTGTPNKL